MRSQLRLKDSSSEPVQVALETLPAHHSPLAPGFRST